jgi:O-methyltransferase
LLEAGVWRGGACIMMRGVLAAYGITDRTVWVADSFEGLPSPDPINYPADTGDRHSTHGALRVSLEDVQTNFHNYGLLDGQVKFLKGWFKDTLAAAPIERLAVLRLDGDMYSSTIQTLEALYDKLSPGGYLIVDDYILDGCRQAIEDFRARTGIRDEINDIDGAAVFWRKS